MGLELRVLARMSRSAPRWGREAEVSVRLRGGFEPSVIHAYAGRRLRLVFRREETSAQSQRVVFPAFGRSATLPPFEEVALDLLPEKPGEYEFACELGLPRGLLVVSEEPLRPLRPTKGG